MVSTIRVIYLREYTSLKYFPYILSNQSEIVKNYFLIFFLLFAGTFSACHQNLRRKFHIFFSILLTHEGSHREAYRNFQPSLTSSAGGAKGFSDHRFRAPTAYTAQLLTLHQYRGNNQYRTWLIKSSRL